jgi:glycosyltransferase involved in cell wall biosynthesis
MNTLSVVTLSRNQGDFVGHAIQSVISQDIAKEYFVYDVGSSDNSRSKISEFAGKLSVILVDEDSGPSDGLNKMFRNVTGSILYYLNSDDRAVDGALRFAVNYFDNNPDCDVLHGSVKVINRIGEYVAVKPSMKFSLLGYALGYSVVYQQATFFRKEIFDGTGFNLENRTCWDGELIVDMAIAGANIHQTSKILGEFRIYPESITGSGRFHEQIRRDHARIAYKILGRKLRKSDIFLGLVIGKFKALLRRIFVLRQVGNLN